MDLANNKMNSLPHITMSAITETFGKLGVIALVGYLFLVHPDMWGVPFLRKHPYDRPGIKETIIPMSEDEKAMFLNARGFSSKK